MKTPRTLPDASHVSAAVRAANPGLFPPVQLPTEKLAREVYGKDEGGLEARREVHGATGTTMKDEVKKPAGKPSEKKLKLNKTELRMWAWLKVRKWKSGKYEGPKRLEKIRPQGMSLRWGVDAKTGAYMTYTPDFVVTLLEELEFSPIGTEEERRWVMIEVKGAHIRERDIARFKGCRADWPQFDFEMWQWKGGEWNRVL